MDLNRFARWAAKEIRLLTPSGWIREYRKRWGKLFPAMLDADGLFETNAYVVSRWEFLGGLYRGNVEMNTDCTDAVAFAKKFLEGVNSKYKDVHNLVGRTHQNQNQSDMFMMIRNRPFHAADPAAILVGKGRSVAVWRMAYDDPKVKHLSLDRRRRLHVNARKLYTELLDATELFAKYLDANTDKIQGLLPQDRYMRAAWARHRPHAGKKNPNAKSWMQLGEKRYGIPS
jgi:hypothetical protein